MNSNIIALDDALISEFNFRIRNQPRKLMLRKNKKEKDFLEFESETDRINKHRQNYKRGSAKYAWRSADLLN